MTVTIINGQMKVTLSETETVKYNIDRVFFDKTCEAAGKALSYLLKTAAPKVGFKTDATRFAIELYPVFSGGCEIYYIPDPVDRKPIAKAAVKRWAIFEFNSSDGMLQACEVLFKDPKTRFCVSELYRYRGKYRLAVNGIGTAAHRTVGLDLADRVLTKPLERAKTLEYATVLCPKNAIAVIGSAMCKEPLS